MTRTNQNTRYERHGVNPGMTAFPSSGKIPSPLPPRKPHSEPSPHQRYIIKPSSSTPKSLSSHSPSPSSNSSESHPNPIPKTLHRDYSSKQSPTISHQPQFPNPHAIPTPHTHTSPKVRKNQPPLTPRLSPPPQSKSICVPHGVSQTQSIPQPQMKVPDKPRKKSRIQKTQIHSAYLMRSKHNTSTPKKPNRTAQQNPPTPNKPNRKKNQRSANTEPQNLKIHKSVS